MDTGCVSGGESGENARATAQESSALESATKLDVLATNLRVDFSLTSRVATTRQDEDNPPISLVSEVSASSRRSTALFSTTDMVDIVIDLLPGIALIVPPCIIVNQRTIVEVHIDRSDLHSDKQELVATAGGEPILKQKLKDKTSVVARMELAPWTVGIIDFFVCGKDDKGRAAAGMPGHLSVLPSAAANDVRMIFENLVEEAEQEQRLLIENVEGAKSSGSESAIDNSETETQPVSYSRDHMRESELAGDDAGVSAVKHGPQPALLYSTQPQLVDPQISDSSESRVPSDPLVVSYAYLPPNLDQGMFIDMLAMQKSVWKTKFLPFVLELEVILQSLKPTAKASTNTGNGTGLELGPTFLLVLENMLRNLCLLEAWELISLVLSRAAEEDIGVFWGNERLPYDALTADKLKEKAGLQKQQAHYQLEIIKEDLLETNSSVFCSVESMYLSVDSCSTSTFEELKSQEELYGVVSEQEMDTAMWRVSEQQDDIDFKDVKKEKELTGGCAEREQLVDEELGEKVVDDGIGSGDTERIDIDRDLPNAEERNDIKNEDIESTVDETMVSQVMEQNFINIDPADVLEDADDRLVALASGSGSSGDQQINEQHTKNPPHGVSQQQRGHPLRRLLQKASKSMSHHLSGDIHVSSESFESSKDLLHSMAQVLTPSLSSPGIVNQGDSPSSHWGQTRISGGDTCYAPHQLSPVEEKKTHRKTIGRIWKSMRKSLLKTNDAGCEDCASSSASSSQSKHHNVKRVFSGLTRGFGTERRPGFVEDIRSNPLPDSTRS